MAEVIKQEAQKKIELARQYYTLAEKEGFFSHFGAYNEEILRPLKNAGEFTADGVAGFFCSGSELLLLSAKTEIFAS